MRLIDADEMAMNESEAYMSAQVKLGFDSLTAQVNSVVHAKVQQLIADTPTIEAEPVRHGRWRTINVPKKWGGATLRCSECNTGVTKAWNFCPNCGAKMGGGGRE